MSAIGYLFARDMQKELKVPFGIITEAFGASTAEAWTSREALAADPQLNQLLAAFDANVAAYKTHPPDMTAALKAWQVAADAATAAGRTAPRRPSNGNPAQDQHSPTVMFNGMMQSGDSVRYSGRPLVSGRSHQRGRHRLQTLSAAAIHSDQGLASALGRGQFPVLHLPVAPLKPWPNRADTWYNNPAVREAQATVLSLTNTGMAVTIDIGDPSNIHPKDKQDVADRLTRIALANTYGHKIEYLRPAV